MEFTADWFSRQLPNWKQHLTPLAWQPIRCLEIGSYEGRSALWVVDNILNHTESSITCIDPHCTDVLECEPEFEYRFDEAAMTTVRDRFLKNTEFARKSGKLTHISQPSRVALRTFIEPFDFIYIDGSHYGSDVLTDAVLSWLVLREGGIMAFDDYRWRSSSPVRRADIAKPGPAIDCWMRLWEGQFERLPSTRAQVWLRRTVGHPTLQTSDSRP